MTESVESRVQRMEEAVSELGVILRGLPTEEQAALAVEMDRKLSRILTLLLIPVVVSLFFVGAAFVQAREAEGAVKENRRGVHCLLEEIAEHRITNHDIHDRIAEALDIEPTIETPLPTRPTAEYIQRLCAPFYETNNR